MGSDGNRKIALVIEEEKASHIRPFRIKSVELADEKCLKCEAPVIKGAKICPSCGFDLFADQAGE